MEREPTPQNMEMVGWSKSFPQTVVARLLREFPSLDFTGVTLVVQGSRAGRRIKSLLADEAAGRKLAMVPPNVCTPGQLLSEMVEFSKPLAGTFARKAAWARGLMRMSAGIREVLFPHPPAAGDFSGWFRVAGLLEQCERELAAAGLSFGGAAWEAGWKFIGDRDRWDAAEKAETAYLAELKIAGLADEQHERNEAIKAGRIVAPGRIILAGVPQLARQMRMALEAAREQGAKIAVWIYAEEKFAGHFDEWGAVRPEMWAREILPIERAEVRVAAGAREVAQGIFRAMGEMKQNENEAPRVDEVTIGILDESLVPFVEAEASLLGADNEIPVRWGVGKSLPATRPYQLLEVVAGFLETRRFRHFVLLARHPDFRRWLSGKWAEGEKKIAEPEWLALLDDYAGAFLPDVMNAECAEKEGWRASEDVDLRAELAWLFARAVEFCAAKGEAAARWTLNELAPRIMTPLRLAYGQGAWDMKLPEHLAVVRSCVRLKEGAEELWKHAIAPEETKATHAEGIALLLALTAGERAVPASTGAEIEMVGWLELMPDDARRVIVAGFNEGYVPENSRADSFLTNTVRGELGLADDAERYARDAYLLTAMLLSRPAGAVTLIAGKVNAEGDPLLPSRLMFAGKREELPRRVMEFAGDVQRGRGLKYRAVATRQAGGRGGFGKILIPPAEQIVLPESMSVTAFREYLASPAGFYLKFLHNRRGIATIDADAPRELAVMDFGSLVHAVLQETMTPEASGQVKSAREWEDRLMAVLRRHVAGVYGSNLTASLRFQVALLEKRFEKVAQWQHEWGKEGWRIKHCEEKLTAALDVDGEPMGIRGKIDRVDERGAEVAVLDYKICVADKTPENSHLAGRAWVDLQLPLYQILAAELARGRKVNLGYVRIADDPKFIGVALARWGPAEIAAAQEVAREVVRNIRAWKFDEVGDSPPGDGIFGHIFGTEILDMEEEEG